MANLGYRPIRIAALGLGWVASNRHAKAIRGNREFELIGAIDHRRERVERFAATFRPKHQGVGTALRSFAWLDDVDAVSVSASPQAHFSLIKEALELGKHVITEKPFVMSVDEGVQLLDIAKSRGLILAVVHNFQFARSAQLLFKDLGDRRLGRIRSIVATQLSNRRRRLPEWYEQLPLGLFYDESPHLLYLIRRAVGGTLGVESAFASASADGSVTPALVSAQLTGRRGDEIYPVSLDINFAASVSEWYFAVHCDEGVGIVDLFRDVYLRIPNDEQHSAKTVLRTSLSATWQHWSQYFVSGTGHLSGTLLYGNDEVFAHFAQAIRSGAEPRDISAADALEVVRLQHTIIQLASRARSL